MGDPSTPTVGSISLRTNSIRHGKKQSYTTSVLSSCRQLRELTDEGKRVVLDGQSLDLSSVFAVAHNGLAASTTDDKDVLSRMHHSVHLLRQKLAQGEVIYGVNTGFGGSADTRTQDYATLQKALIQHHNAAVLLPSDRGLGSSVSSLQHLGSHCMPVPIVRAAMLTRCNSLLRGHSAVRVQVVEHILTLLAHGLTPVVPLRGSISASGDLTPLAYIAGALEGNPDISVHNAADDQIIPADEALKEAGLVPLDFGPKEGLGLLNGTAFSGGAASLVLFEANQLVLLSQVLTAMGTEALLGTRYNYHPFIADARPHDGQREAAANIFKMLADSKLAKSPTEGSETANHGGLAQDRYALRTSTQWIGPQIENMALSLKQVVYELNSTTDNPLLDPEEAQIHHGGNFQAASVTSAMEKTMGAMQMLGRMIFSQCSEIINPTLSRGLPPNLSVDDPSLSFAFKGVDINMASYMSELAYLNHPVSNHVQSAEMHNQGLNSLAFIACRYAADAVEVLSLMAATYLYVLCQALDLRSLHLEFVKDARCQVDDITAELYSPAFGARLPAVQNELWGELMNHWSSTSTSNLPERGRLAASYSVGVLLSSFAAECNSANSNLTDAQTVQHWQTRVCNVLHQSYATTRETFLTSQTTKSYLCSSSRNFYVFVREKLAVPMHRGIADHPTYDSVERRKKECIGTQISKVYTALRKGEFQDVLVSCW
ncbi:L-Aspartase-like protein [Aspergillus pseudotamarii]|uniref:L-Aspartase-like protein n=1 Tax=Aspergillus pseudotamarii TaxID=132259 RepID=A0A5N6SVQ0_ASPPS|nr:L-Aspartase-like protein [Aspergillus pseudotamarii]KAE8137967.1 L-Aspartase-like protein [Aspergillus pseudotamarii]